MDDFAIKVENVSKTFKLPHEKNNSIKSAIVNFYRRDKGYDLQKALNGVSFEVKRGEFFGIVGRNGSGKSTLLKLLAGIYTPTSGQVHVRGSLTPFIELGVGFSPELTGRENVYLNGSLLGFSRKDMQRMYKDIVEFAELGKFMDQKLKNYSSGMQVRLAFSIAIRAESDILLLDEVLAVGDAAFQRKCYKYFKQLKKDKRTVVFISHDMEFVRGFCDKGILMDRGELKLAGTSQEIAREYSLQFMDGYDDGEKVRQNAPKRLGNGAAKFKKVEAKVDKDKIIIKASVKISEKVDELLYGLHILSEDGSEITSMNNRMLNYDDIKELKPGAEVSIQWDVMNIFTEGRYSIKVALVDGSFTQLDYFEEAAHFNIKRQEKSNTSVLPPIHITTKVRY